MSSHVQHQGANPDQDDQIEKDAEKAYRNMSMEARVVGNLVSGVDDEDFEQVWEEKSSHSSNTVSKTSSVQPKTALSALKAKEEPAKPKDSSTVIVTSASSGGMLSPSSLAGFQTVSLTTLPGSRLQITR